MALLTHDNGDKGNCISRRLGHSIGPAVTNDSSNPLLWSADASWGLSGTSLSCEGNSLKMKLSEGCVCLSVWFFLVHMCVCVCLD